MKEPDRKLLQDGLSVGFRGQSAPVIVPPGSVTVEFTETDPETREKTVLAIHELEAKVGDTLVAEAELSAMLSDFA